MAISGGERVTSTRVTPSHPTDLGSSWDDRHRTTLVVAAAALPVFLYLVFVGSYSINLPNMDDWSVVSLVASSISGHLTWGDLWMQHNENRMLLPNLLFILVGRLTRVNFQVDIAVSAALFVATYATFLLVVRRFVGPPLRPLLVLVVGAMWFSLSDWQNAIWAFQMAWYLVLFFLVTLLYLLLVAHRSWPVLALAVGVAVAASISSLQGLFLWPVGLMCLLWPTPWRGWLTKSAVRVDALVWVASAALTSAAYFVGYESAPGNPGNLFPRRIVGLTSATPAGSFILHHLGYSAQFLLVEIGNVVPIGGPSVWPRTVIGAVLLAGAVFVVVDAVIHRRPHVTIDCLPVALIIFALLFDLVVLAGRSSFGIWEAMLSRYTMGNILLVLALFLHAWRRLRTKTLQPTTRRALFLAVAALVVVQVASASNFGISQATASKRHVRASARLAATIDLAPSKDRLCYSVAGLLAYGVPYLTPTFEAEIKRDGLTIFASGPYRALRSQGLPVLNACAH
jgi:hypothetical protein